MRFPSTLKAKLYLPLICLGIGLTACTANHNSKSEGFESTENVVQTLKPGAAIDMSYTPPQDLSPSQNGKLVLSFLEGYDRGALSISVRPSEGLRFVSEVPEKEFSLSGLGPHIVELDVMAARDGIYYVSVFAEVTAIDGPDTARSFSARIDVGDINSENAYKSFTPNGTLSSDEATVNLPAEEVIR